MASLRWAAWHWHHAHWANCRRQARAKRQWYHLRWVNCSALLAVISSRAKRVGGQSGARSTVSGITSGGSRTGNLARPNRGWARRVVHSRAMGQNRQCGTLTRKEPNLCKRRQVSVCGQTRQVSLAMGQTGSGIKAAFQMRYGITALVNRQRYQAAGQLVVAITAMGPDRQCITAMARTGSGIKAAGQPGSGIKSGRVIPAVVSQGGGVRWSNRSGITARAISRQWQSLRLAQNRQRHARAMGQTGSASKQRGHTAAALSL